MSEIKLVSAKQAVNYRNYRRARDRALSRLAKAYPNDYKELLEEEKASDEQLGKKWFATDTLIGVTFVDTRASDAAIGSQAADGGEDEGNGGGEA
jgi:hypothetical protein